MSETTQLCLDGTNKNASLDYEKDDSHLIAGDDCVECGAEKTFTFQGDQYCSMDCTNQ